MTDAVERIVNLALYLADASAPVPYTSIRAEVAGYTPDQDDAAFLRMFERDKDVLRDAGFAIEADERGRYWLDRSTTFSSAVEFAPEESAAVRAAGSALLGDPSFPFAADLRLALAKVSSGAEPGDVPAMARLADESPERQGATVASLADAASSCKRVTFAYTNSHGATAPRTAEPYGLFLHDGRWYLVARDVAKDDARTYTVARISDIEVDAGRPKSPDFERPADFDVRRFVRLPFQYGRPDDEFEATLRFEPSVAWRAQSVATGEGRLTACGDGSAEWRVAVRSRQQLLRFAVENGPGIRVVAPGELADELRAGLEEVARAHG